MQEIIEPNTNPEIKTYSTEEGVLKIKKTHAVPTIKNETFNIVELQSKIAGINSVIGLWENKKKPYLDLIALYNEYKPVVIPEPIEEL